MKPTRARRSTDEPVEMIDLTDEQPAHTPKGDAASEQQLQMLQAATAIADQAPNLDAALSVALRLLCRETGWAVGQAWLPSLDGSVLECSGAWYGSVGSLTPLRDASRRVRYEKGVGLPGRVWSQGRPAWVRDAPAALSQPRASAARRVGILGAFAVPVVCSGEVVAVLEFFSLEPRDDDRRLLMLVSEVAAGLGPLIDRRRTEERLADSAGWFRLLAESATDAIFSVDARGLIRFWNSRAAAMFGYTADEVSGQPVSLLIPARLRERHGKSLHRAAREGDPTLVGRTVELTALRKGGAEFTIELSLSSFEHRGDRWYTAVVRDITERRFVEGRRAEILRKLSQETREATADIIASVDLLQGRWDSIPVEERARSLRYIRVIVQQLEEVPNSLSVLAEIDGDANATSQP